VKPVFLIAGRQIGEYVLVHVGFAISKVDEEEAERTYQYLSQIDQLSELQDGEEEEPGMKFLDEYRDQTVAQKLVDEIKRTVTQPWVLMEVCGARLTRSSSTAGLSPA